MLIKERIAILEKEVEGLKAMREAAKVNKEKFNASPLYKKQRDLDILALLNELNADRVVISAEGKDTLARLTDPAVYEAIEVKEGDKLIDLLATYIDRKDIYTKLLAAADETGLQLVGDVFKAKA